MISSISGNETEDLLRFADLGLTEEYAEYLNAKRFEAWQNGVDPDQVVIAPRSSGVSGPSEPVEPDRERTRLLGHAGSSDQQADTLARLLHIGRVVGRAQREDGTYRENKRTRDQYANHLITEAEFTEHRAGRIALALSPVSGNDAHFGVIEIDKSFPERLPIVREVIQRVGGDTLADACFATDGSDQGRGKVVFTFSELVPRQHAYDLVHHIMALAKASPGFGPVGRDDIDLFPMKGDGGVVRVLGSNPKRNGPMERAWTFDGGIDLGDVAPVSAAYMTSLAAALDRQPTSVPTMPIATGSCDLGAKTKTLIQTPWTREKSNRDVHKACLCVASEIIRVLGFDAVDRYDVVLGHIIDNSPELDSLPSKTTKKRTNPVREELRTHNAWHYMCKNYRARFTPQAQPADIKPRNHDARKLYLAVAAYVLAENIPHWRFQMANSVLAKHMGLDPKNDYHRVRAHRALKHGAQLGLFVIIDRGCRREAKGDPGRTQMIGLIGQGETAESILKVAENDPVVIAARARAAEDEVRHKNGQVRIAQPTGPDDYDPAVHGKGWGQFRCYA